MDEKMLPRDERIPGEGKPMLSYVESAELQAQIAGMILAAKNQRNIREIRAWENLLDNEGDTLETSHERCTDSFEQARELLTYMGLFRPIPGVKYGER